VAGKRSGQPLIVFAPADAPLAKTSVRRPLAGATVVPSDVAVFIAGSAACERCEWLLNDSGSGGGGGVVKSMAMRPFFVGGANQSLASVIAITLEQEPVSLAANLLCGGRRVVLTANFTAASRAALASAEMRELLNAQTPAPSTTGSANGAGFVAVDAATTRSLEIASLAILVASGILILVAAVLVERSGRREMLRRRGLASDELPTVQQRLKSRED